MTENKGDLISREALKTAIEQGEGFSWDSYGKDDLCVRKKYIDNAPTVEAIPTELHEKIMDKVEGELLECQSHLRPQGEWIKEYKDFKCSLCGKIAYSWNNHGTYIQIKSDFCPHCGAEMIKGGAE